MSWSLERAGAAALVRSPRVGRSLTFAVGLLAAAVPSQVRASELSWDGPIECAERDLLLFTVERALGVPLAEAARLQFDVRVESSAAAMTARLRVSSGSSGEGARERVLAASDCSKLIDTLAVAITLAIGASEAPVPAAPRPASALPRPRQRPWPPAIANDLVIALSRIAHGAAGRRWHRPSSERHRGLGRGHRLSAAAGARSLVGIEARLGPLSGASGLTGASRLTPRNAARYGG